MTDADVARSPDDRRDESIRAAISALDATAVAWLAVAPVWTLRVAERVGFPSKPRSLPKLIREAAALGWCVTEGALPGTDDEAGPNRSEQREAQTRAQILVLLATRIGGQLVDQALDAIARLDSVNQRARSLVDLAVAVTPDRFARAKGLADSVDRLDLRAQALAALANVAPPDERQAIASEAVELARTARPRDRAVILSQASLAVDAGQRSVWMAELLRTAAETDDERERGRMLEAAAPVVPDDLAPEFTRLMVGLTGDTVRAQVLSASATSGPLVAGIAEIARQASSGSRGATATQPALVTTFATALAGDGDIDAAVGVTRQIDDPATRGRTLGNLAGQLGASTSDRRDTWIGDLVGLAVGEIEQVSGAATAAMLGSVANILLDRKILEAARSVLAKAIGLDLGSSVDAVEPRVALARALERTGDSKGAAIHAEAALTIASTSGDASARVKVIADLGTSLPPATRGPALVDAANVIATCNDPVERGRLLSLVGSALDATTFSGLLTRTLELVGDRTAETTFWMPEVVRGNVLRILHADARGGAIRRLAFDIARKVVVEVDGGLAMPADLEEWARFTARVEATSTDAAARALTADVNEALRRGDIDRAVALAAAATSAASSVGAELDLAVQLARRAINLKYRTDHDKVRLKDYLRRDEQIAALETLLAATEPGGDNRQWAVHLLGVGGVGKTMLLRYLSAELAEGRNLAVARIDFDYINPDFPVTRPAELLAEFLGELLRYGPRQNDVRDLESAIAAFHAQLKAERPADPLAGIRMKSFALIAGRFRAILESLGRPVVLVLDTCEELAKGEVDLDRQRLPAVEATFDILEMVKTGLPKLRVIFAGRRLLAQSGAGWQSRPPTVAHRGRAPADGLGKQAFLPAKKDYLRLHEVRGFDTGEASIYLRERKGLTLDADAEATILRLSPEIVPVSTVEWTDQAAKPPTDRFNPFDLSIYAEWVRELGGNVRPGQLEESGRDLYVERRVLGRLVNHPDVRALVPAAFLLRRFDQRMIGPAYPGSDRPFPAAFRELASQEWIELTYPADRNTEICEVQRGLINRMRTFYDGPTGTPERTQAEARLVRSLERSMLEAPLAELTVEEVDAGVRLLDKAASPAFQLLIADLVEGEEWGRIDQISGRLSDVDGAVADPKAPLRAAVRDARAAFLMRPTTSGDAAALGPEILAAVPNEPDRAVQAWIRERVEARGLAPASQTVVPASTWARVRTFGERVSAGAFPTPPRPAPRAGSRSDPVSRAEHVAAAWCSGITAVLESKERSGTGSVVEAGAISDWARDLPKVATSPELAAFAEILAARAERLAGSPGDGLARAVMAAVSAPTDAVRQRWLDWHPPERIADRAWLEAIRLAAPHLGPTGETLSATEIEGRRILKARVERDEVLTELGGRLASVDAERLASAILSWRLDRGPVPEAILVELDRRETDVRSQSIERRPSCNAHAAVPPLFVTLARGWLAAGHPGIARQRLEACRSAATAGNEATTARIAQDALLRLARRLRMPQIDGSLVDDFANPSEPDRLALALPVIALARGKRADDQLIDRAATAAPVLWWSCQQLLRPGRKAAVDRLRQRDAPMERGRAQPADPADSVSRMLDLVEASHFYREIPWEIVDPIFPHDPWAVAHPAEVDAAIRLTLRASALGVPRSEDDRIARYGSVLQTPPSDKPSQSTEDAMKRQQEARSRAARTAAGLASVRSWVADVGARRVAEIALEVGELLALRLPEQAREPLELAAELFETAHDPLGGFVASTQLALASAHQRKAGQPQHGWPSVQRAMESYRRLAEQPHAEPVGLDPEPMPPADDLIGDVNLADGPVGESWAGWIQRFRLVHAWSRPRSLARRVIDFVVSGQGRRDPVAGEAKALPVELILDPSTSSAARSGGGLSIGRVVTFIGSVLILYLIVSQSVTTLFSVSDVLGAVIVIAVVVGLGVLAALQRRWIVGRLRAAWTTLDRVRLEEVDPDEQAGPAGRASVVVALTVRSPDAGPLRLSAPLQLVTNLLRAIAVPVIERPPYAQSGDREMGVVGFQDGSYRNLASALPHDVAGRLRGRAQAVDPYLLPVAVAADRPTAPQPWEAAVLLAAAPEFAKTGVAHLEPYRVSRATAGGSGTSAGTPARRGRWPVMVIASTSWLSAARAGWQGETMVASRPGDVSPRGPRVLHIVGNPLETTTGVVLAINAASSAQSSSSAAQELTIEASQLPVASLGLIVVQGEPESMDERRAIDRDRSANLRAFAADLHAAGAASVIVIPPLPSALGEEVIGLIAQHLAPRSVADRLRAAAIVRSRREASDPEYSLFELVQTTHAIRERIVKWTAAHPDAGQEEAALELALDVAMFTRPSQRELAMDGLEA